MTRQAALRLAIAAVLVVLAGPLLVPQVLAFPYHARSNGSEIWSEAPLPQAQIDAVTARAATLVAKSPLARSAEPRHIFLTRGDWRWTWLTLTSRGAFGVTRGLIEAVVINRSDLAADHVWNGATVGGQRSLSGVIVHETCHGIERRHFGLLVDWTKPAWLREGYCDYVAQESSLSDADAARLKAVGQSHPALPYYDGRRRIAAILARNGGDIDALFAAN